MHIHENIHDVQRCVDSVVLIMTRLDIPKNVVNNDTVISTSSTSPPVYLVVALTNSSTP